MRIPLLVRRKTLRQAFREISKLKRLVAQLTPALPHDHPAHRMLEDYGIKREDWRNYDTRFPSFPENDLDKERRFVV